MKLNTHSLFLLLGSVTFSSGATVTLADSVAPVDTIWHELDEVQVVQRRASTLRGRGVTNTVTLNKGELMKAACCNLGESFTTNPSVDVNYSDATTGARQIKLLGLSGQYVQMLGESVPAHRMVAMPYALSFVPGPWIESIQVSKGASSVKNGYESVTGQINTEFLKPQLTERLDANAFVDTKGRFELNASGNRHLNDRWSTGLLFHYQDAMTEHDGNGDGFADMPRVRQLSLKNRWAYFSPRYIFQASVTGLTERRRGGQVDHHGMNNDDRYRIGLSTDRLEGFAKNAFFLDDDQNANLAVIVAGSLHYLSSHYGKKHYNADNHNAYASLLFEKTFAEHHLLSAGLSLNHDYIDERYRLVHDEVPWQFSTMRETTAGAYTQYTFSLGERASIMTGVRLDHSSRFGWFATPRVHLKYAPSALVTLRASLGKGYRSAMPLAEHYPLLATGRTLVFDGPEQEAAWNGGLNTSWSIPVAGKTLKLDVEYYYTHFDKQLIIDYDSDPSLLLITRLDGRSWSHTFQVEASMEPLRGMTVTGAIRVNDVRCTLGGELRRPPLTSRYKGLLSISYAPGLGLWQFDATLQLNGGGRLPAPQSSYHAYEQLQAQVTRNFRHFSIYVGGENLTGRRQHNPIMGADAPWTSAFEPTLVWGPTEGAMFYAGIRLNFKRK